MKEISNNEIFPINIDTARSTIDVLNENLLTLNEAVNQDQNDVKKMLKQKWQQVNSLGK